MAEKKKGIRTAKDEAGDLQQQLDHFIDNFQDQLDACMDEHPQEAEPNTDFEMPAEVDPFGLEEHDHTLAAPESLAHLEEKAAAQHIETTNANISESVKQTASDSTHPSSAGHHIISRLLIVSGGLVAILAWVIWDQGLLNNNSNLLDNIQPSHSEDQGSAAANKADGNALIDAVTTKTDTKESLTVEIPDQTQSSQVAAKQAVMNPESTAALAGADETAKPAQITDQNATDDSQKIAALVGNPAAVGKAGSKAAPKQPDQTANTKARASTPVLASTKAHGKTKPVASTQKKPAQSTANAGEAKLKVTATIGNIRSEPSLQGKVLYRLKKGATVTRLEERDGWYKIRLQNGSIAWGYHTIF